MNESNLIMIGAILIIVFSLLSSIIYTLLKRKWKLYEKPRPYYSGMHKILHWTTLGMGIFIIISLALYHYLYQPISPITVIFVLFLILPTTELIRVYMQKKYGENPKWIYLTLFNFGFSTILLGMAIVIYQFILT